MILEHAILNVQPERQVAFEAAMRQALPLIAATPGFISLKVAPCVEQAGRYLLLVEWQRLDDHTQGFRGSARYQQWKALLHHFYEPFPVVEHYAAPIISRTA